MKISDKVGIPVDLDEVDYCLHFTVMESPFNYEFDCSKFYGGASRTTILEDILLKARNKDDCIFIKAEQGSGKTAICRMVEQEMRDGLCLYANCSGNRRTISLEKQLAEGLLLEAAVFMPAVHVESELLRKLNTHDRLVILLEGVDGISGEQYSWLREMQIIAKDQGKSITFVFFYSDNEKVILEGQFSDMTTTSMELSPFTEYEVFEYLNSHMESCGNRDQTVFRRTMVKAIATESIGNISKVVALGNGALRQAFRRGVEFPSACDILVSQGASQNLEDSMPALAFMTARNTVLVGILSGSIVLALIWSLFGSGFSEEQLLVINSEALSGHDLRLEKK